MHLGYYGYMNQIISIKNINKVYQGGFQALSDINLDITKGEIFALLGPNGAGKTTLISTICGLCNQSSGSVLIDGNDTVKDYRNARKLIGLVPQELTTDAFETVWDTVSFSRGLFGLAANPKLIEKILKDLSLWDKKDNKLMTLSGGMKRRVLIAKALSHEPKILFLDEPTAGVDVDLRKDMWQQVRQLQESGVTIILTTHYIEEAEEMADRIGVIINGELILVQDKKDLMNKLGSKELIIELQTPIKNIPPELEEFSLKISDGKIIYKFDSHLEHNGASDIFAALRKHNLEFKDIITKQSSLEDIFVELVNNNEN
jgi:ABC-2 type transport system ATP-binding protein